MSEIVYGFLLNNEQQKETLNKSKVKFIWFEKLNKQKTMGSSRRVKAIDSKITLEVVRAIEGNND